MLKKLTQFFGPGPLAMTASSLFFAVMALLVKMVGNTIPLFQISFFRTAVSSVIILMMMLGRGISFRGSNQKLLLLRGTAGFTAMVLNFYAIAHIPLADAAILTQSTPFFVLLLSCFFLKEKIQFHLVTLTLLCFCGILVVLHPEGRLFNLGGVAALASAFFAAVAYVSIRHLHRTDSFWTMAFYFMTMSALFSLPPMLLEWKNPNALEWLCLLGAGLFGTFGQLLMTFAYKHDEASWVAPFAYAGALFSFFGGAVFFGEIPTLATLGGGILVIGGGLGILRLKKKTQLSAE